MKPTSWRVRVRRATETWVDVSAFSAADAELEALKVPGVLTVFARSAIRGDFVAPEKRPAGVEEAREEG